MTGADPRRAHLQALNAHSPEFQALRQRIEGFCREAGLDFFDVVFEMVDYQTMNEIASYTGFPSRYPHWTFGMEYDRLSKSYAYGLHKIYELVINNDPCYAYLLEGNSRTYQKMVMAHVFAHADFFKHNMWFAHTYRKMMDEMANHSTRIRRYIERHGQERVERLLDICLSLDSLIDYHAPHVTREREAELETEPHRAAAQVQPLKSKTYMDQFINPPEYLEAQRQKRLAARAQAQRFPPEPVRDVLKFLIDHSPLETWQRDLLEVVREEAYYFAPQGQTKIMNEGWATFWHSTIMTTRALSGAELIDYAECHAATVATTPGQINPYKLGFELFKDIKERWDKGRHGPQYERCADRDRKRTWDTGEGRGLEKIFEVRRIYNDITFIDTFLTEEFCQAQKLFTFQYNPGNGQYEIQSREFQEVKRQFLFSLTNLGNPIIEVLDGNYENRGELYLRHDYQGVKLRADYARDTLANIHALWTRPVHLETVDRDKRKCITYNGADWQERTLDDAPAEA